MESQQETSGGGGGTESQQQPTGDDEEAEHIAEEAGQAGEGGPANKGKKRKPKAPKPPTEPRIKWTSKEDECLAEAWKTVGIDPITGANQNADHYWKRVKTSYDERRLVDPDFQMINMERGEKAMANHWALIQQACNKWHGIQEEVQARPESGANVEMTMVRMFEAYRNDNDQAEFKFLHVFLRIESCEKWKEVRQALGKGKEYIPDAPAAGAAEGRPIDHKKAKAARDSAPTGERLQASIDRCISDAQTHAVVREEKLDARWAAIMAKQDIKLDLLKTNVAAKKRNTDLAFLIGGDTATMDEEVKAWYLAGRRAILDQIAPVANQAPPTAAPSATPAPPPSSAPESTTPSSAAPPPSTATPPPSTATPPPSTAPTATPSSAPTPATTVSPILLEDDAEESPSTI